MTYRPPNDENACAKFEFDLGNHLKDWPADCVIVMDELLTRMGRGWRPGDRHHQMYIAEGLRRHGFERVKQRVNGAPRWVWRRR